MELTNSLSAWGSPDFKTVLQKDIQAIDPALLPLQKGLSLSSYVSEKPFYVTILNVTDSDKLITAKTGIFYTGIIAGCSCADDPTPQDEQQEYCEIQFSIDKTSAHVTFFLLDN
jgi:hypothetical protein